MTSTSFECPTCGKVTEVRNYSCMECRQRKLNGEVIDIYEQQGLFDGGIQHPAT